MVPALRAQCQAQRIPQERTGRLPQANQAAGSRGGTPTQCRQSIPCSWTGRPDPLQQCSQTVGEKVQVSIFKM